ncbi:MAG: hypothetical protein JWQ52_1722 [Phenylobacterium sp.]|nr:hypothetical protein [Phenylobacterium sp.]
MRARGSPWLRLGVDSLWLGVESQRVMMLRMMKLAAGGPAAAAEAQLMVAEKMRAAAEMQAQVVTSVMTGKGHLAPSRAVASYRRKVRANGRRLGKG